MHGAYFTWIRTQVDDGRIVDMLGSSSTSVGIRPRFDAFRATMAMR